MRTDCAAGCANVFQPPLWLLLPLALTLAAPVLAAPVPATPVPAKPVPATPVPATPVPATPVPATSSAVEDIRAEIRALRFAEAEARARARYDSLGVRHSDDPLALAEALDLLVESLWRGGKSGAEETRMLAQKAVDMRETSQGGHQLELARSLLSLGNVLALRGDYRAARPGYERALAIRERALGADHPDVAGALNNLANLHRLTGDLATARPLFQRALAIRERALGFGHPDVAASLNNLGIVYLVEGDFAAARSLFERSLSTTEKISGASHPQVVNAVNNLAIICQKTGDYASARTYYERALAASEASMGPDHPEVASALNNIGTLFEEMGDYEAARSAYERALTIRERAWGPEHREVAESTINMSIIFAELGDLKRALDYALRAEATYEKTVGPYHPDLAQGLEYLAEVLARSGDYSGARRHYQRALAIVQRAHGSDHPLVIRMSHELGVALLRQGESSASAQLLTAALAAQEKHVGPLHPRAARLRRDLARARLALGDSAAAFQFALDGEAIARNHLRLTARTLAERPALRYSRSLAGNLDLILGLAAADRSPALARAAWDSQIRSRSVILDEMAARHRDALGASDPATDSLLAVVREARLRLANISVRARSGDEPTVQRQLLERAVQEKEAAERALFTLSRPFELEAARTRIGLAEVLGAIPSGTALVAYSRTLPSVPSPGPAVDQGAYVAFVCRGSSAEVTAVPLGSCAGIDSLLTVWRRAAGVPTTLSDGETAADRIPGAVLRRRIWDPLAGHLDGIKQVFIVPDGSLHLLNFATLPADDGSYLLEHGPLIHYLSTERDLIREPREAGRGLLVVGSPDFESTRLDIIPAVVGARLYRSVRSDCQPPDGYRFTPLPATDREAREVARLWNRERRHEGVISLVGSAAEEGRVKRGIPGRRVVHLATHGFFLGDSCAGAVEGVRGVGGWNFDNRSDRSSATVASNPLLLAGLAMAGANRRIAAGPDEEDGLLTAEEIATLDLRGLEWAVLSACDSGAGRAMTGEGVDGLRRAFETAGAGTLIMSLWPVEDQATLAWMTALYQARLHDGLSTAESVRRASLTVLGERRRRGLSTRPYTWGAFIAAGDWR